MSEVEEEEGGRKSSHEKERQNKKQTFDAMIKMIPTAGKIIIMVRNRKHKVGFLSNNILKYHS